MTYQLATLAGFFTLDIYEHQRNNRQNVASDFLLLLTTIQVTLTFGCKSFGYLAF